ncbi:DNA repair protein RadA [Luteithermobacter gelatinilyticus]|uniref:DNA repair protein RadA n=1 Tax=Luteithermobacter gelatinilyticus TaxID=2582913 RepID=UPI0011073902
MARARKKYVCQSCGTVTSKWMGQCEGCGEWNSLVEETDESLPSGLGRGAANAKGRIIELGDLKGSEAAPPRMVSGIKEFDRACGGGLVPGSALLIGGDPGIGKSTILLQAMSRLAHKGISAVYISGEESTNQVRMRARRLGLADSPVRLGSETSLRDIVSTLEHTTPQVVVIDSIQTMYADTIESAPGTVAQVRTCAQELIRFAKRRNVCVLIVGHVTKDGQIAGPRVLEHMVDTVLYFEGERAHQFRILRAVKNRFGGTDEIGVFEMSDQGLQEVHNPSALFLGNRSDQVTGSAVFAGMEGSRPLLVEMQALVAPSSLATPRRAVVGWDSGRLAMIIAVLDARCGLGLGGYDIYLNVAGGLRINEPAADLAVAAALISSLSGRPIPAETVLFGEISLSGEIRPVGQADARLKESAKLGFEQAYIPANIKHKGKELRLIELDEIRKLVDLVAADFEG